MAVKEARKVGIPVIALVDTNADPDQVLFPIPANDDAIKSIELMCNVVAESIKESREKLSLKKEKEKSEVKTK